MKTSTRRRQSQFAKHRHTGHVLPRHHTSYPLLVMILLCVGVFTAGWTWFATADTLTGGGSYSVTARVPGVAPTQPAVIDSPIDGKVFKESPIMVNGSCPLNTSYVVLYRNNVTSGTALCDGGDNYQISTDLFVGDNELKVLVYNSTDMAGPMSDPVNVKYTPNVASADSPDDTPADSTSGTTVEDTPSEASISDPLLLKAVFNFEAHDIGTPITWQLEVGGGQGPYAISIDWGDGTTSLISRSEAGPFTVSHTYDKVGGFKGSYVVKFSITDSSGAISSLQSLAIVNDPAVPPGAGGLVTPGAPGQTGDYIKHMLKFVWPTYGVSVLMLSSFWLGESHELSLLKLAHFKLPHR